MRKETLPAGVKPFVVAAAVLCCVFGARGQQAQPAKSQPEPTKSTVTQNTAVAPRSGELLAEIKRSGKLRVGVAEIVPWATHDQDGNLVGFEIDVARKLARDLGVQPEFYPEDFRYLISDLLAGRFDLIVSGLSITASRALRVDFSAPYHTTDVTLAANVRTAGASPKLHDFDKQTVTIGVLEGSTAEELAGDALPNAHIKTYGDDGEMFDDLLQGKLDGAVADSPRPEIVAKLFPSNVTCVCDEPLATYPAGFAVRRGNLEFINFLNAWIESHTADKWLESRRHYWFKSTDWAKEL